MKCTIAYGCRVQNVGRRAAATRAAAGLRGVLNGFSGPAGAGAAVCLPSSGVVPRRRRAQRRRPQLGGGVRRPGRPGQTDQGPPPAAPPPPSPGSTPRARRQQPAEMAALVQLTRYGTSALRIAGNSQRTRELFRSPVLCEIERAISCLTDFYADALRGILTIARSARLPVPWRSCLGYRQAGCLQLSHTVVRHAKYKHAVDCCI